MLSFAVEIARSTWITFGGGVGLFTGVWRKRLSTFALVGLVAGLLLEPSTASAAPVVAAGKQSCPASASDESSAAGAAASCGSRVEALSRRSETVQVFVNPDGTSTLEAAAVPQRVRRSNGSWADIDLTLAAGKDGLLRPKASVSDVAFSAGGDGPAATVNQAGRTMTLSWPGVLPAPVISGQEVTYASVLPDVDLVLRATTTGFTHVLVVKTAKAAASPALRQVRFGVGGDATLVRQADGGLRAVAGKSLVASAAPPKMWDSAKRNNATGQVGDATDQDLLKSNAARAGVTAKVAKLAAKLASNGDLLLSPDTTMLSASDTVFPIYIDPGWVTYNKTRWAYANNTNNNWDVNGEAWTGRNVFDGVLYRSYFDFPLSAVAKKYIYKAYMQITLDHSYSCGPTPTSLFWTAGISPNTSPRTTWAPAKKRWLNTTSSNADEDSGCGPAQPDMVVNFDYSGSTVKTLVQEQANVSASQVTLGLCACDDDGANESVQNRWKRWLPNAAKLIIDYDAKPGQPSSLQVAGVACPAGGVGIGTLTPTLSAVYPDGDSTQSLTGTYEWIEVPAGGISTVTDTSPARKAAPAPASAPANA